MVQTRLPGVEASRWSPCGCMDAGLAVSLVRACHSDDLAAG